MTGKQAHHTAVNSYDQNHSDYHTYRPEFTPVIVNPLLVELNLATKDVNGDHIFDTSKKIVEIAAGTGKFTKNLVANGWTDNLTIIEPSTGMLESFKRNFPNIKAVQASSYAIPIEDNSVDAVIIAQGFHWFADADSLKEISRVLKPNGKLGLIWNFDDTSPSQDSQAAESKFYDAGSRYFNTTDFKGNNQDVFKQFFANQKWNQEVTQYIYGFDVNVPQYRHGKWRQIFKNDSYFRNGILDSFAMYDLEIEKQNVWKYWETRSYITDLGGEEKQKIKLHVEKLIEAYQQDSSFSDNNKTRLIKPMGTHTAVLTVNK